MRLSQAPRQIAITLGLGLAASALLAAPARAQAPGTGTITGRLVWAGPALPKPKVEVAKGDPKVKDAVCKTNEILSNDITVDPATKGIANAIVYLVKPTGNYSAAEKELLEKTPEVVVDQVNCEFVPYVAVVHKAQKLTFKSSDPVGHNVHITSLNNPSINTMLPPNGKMDYKIKSEERRPTKVVCDIHPWMTSYIMITDHPFAAVTKADGSFEIPGVPAGAQNLIVWQSKNGYINSGGNKGEAVTVPSGGTVDAGTFKITTLK